MGLRVGNYVKFHTKDTSPERGCPLAARPVCERTRYPRAMSPSACCKTLLDVLRATDVLRPDATTLTTFDPHTGSRGVPIDAHDVAHRLLDARSIPAVFAVLRETQTVERESFSLDAELTPDCFAHEILYALGHCQQDAADTYYGLAHDCPAHA